MMDRMYCKPVVVLLKIVSIASSIGVPVYAVMQKFQLIIEQEKVDVKRFSVGWIMIGLIVLFGLRRQIWAIIKKKLNLIYFGAILFWSFAFAILIGLERVAAILPDLRTICIAGLIGTGVGQAAETVAGFLGKGDN